MIDEPVPDLALPATGGRTIRLRELRGAPFVLYFYPKRRGARPKASSSAICILGSPAWDATYSAYRATA
jgi:peroxiredoxin